MERTLGTPTAERQVLQILDAVPQTRAEVIARCICRRAGQRPCGACADLPCVMGRPHDWRWQWLAFQWRCAGCDLTVRRQPRRVDGASREATVGGRVPGLGARH